MGIADYVIHGRIGGLYLGITRQETLKLLGPPPNWLGRPPNIGFHFKSFDQSDLWIFYEDSVGVRFGGDGVALETLIYPEKIESCPDLFAQWPIRSNPNMGEWRSALQSNNLSFREPDPDSVNYWIVAEETCVASGLTFREGHKLYGYERPVQLIGKYLSVQEMTRSCRFLSMD